MIIEFKQHNIFIYIKIIFYLFYKQLSIKDWHNFHYEIDVNGTSLVDHQHYHELMGFGKLND